MKNKFNIDGILAFLIFTTTVWIDYILYKTISIPFSWRMIAMAMISIITLLLIALTFKKIPTWGRWIRRLFMIIFISLFTFASINVDKVNSLFRNVTAISNENIVTISVVTSKDSDIKKIEDLAGKNVAYQDQSDKDNAVYVKNKLKKSVADIEFASENNYITLAQELKNKSHDALIISDANFSTIEDAIPQFQQEIKVIKTYRRKVAKQNKEHTGKNFDLTQDTFTVLLSGMDNKADLNETGLSDVNMLLIVNPTTNHIEMISFPRDSYIPNPALNNGNDKLTHTGNHGIENTMLAIEQIVGFNLDFYVKVNFASVVEMVDALGGIEVDVPIAFSEQNSDRSFASEDIITLQKGVQMVNGEEALAFARHRKTESVGDIGRTKAQQEVIKGIIARALSAEGATKVPSLLDITAKYVATNISEEQLTTFVSYQLEKGDAWTTSNSTLENGVNVTLTTASQGDFAASCYLLNQMDLDLLYQKYYMILNPVLFKDFRFDLNNLSIDTPPRNSIEMLYSNSDVSSQLPPVEEEYEEPPVEEAPPVEPTPPILEEEDLPPVMPEVPDEKPTPVPPVEEEEGNEGETNPPS